MQALIAEYTNFFVLQLSRQRGLSPFDFPVDSPYLPLLHLVPGHPAGWTVYVLQHFLALNVDQVSAPQVNITFCRVEQGI
jgi:hypothetical protein